MPYEWFYPSNDLPASSMDVYFTPLANTLQVIDGEWSAGFQQFRAPGSSLYYLPELVLRWRPK